VNAGLADVRRAMPARSILISFIRFDQTTYVKRRDRTERRTIPSYIAFLSWSDRADVVSVPLGTAASLEELIATWREDAGGRALISGVDAAQAEQSYRVAGTRLRQRIWDPIAPHVAGVDRIFIVPDAALNLVSFAALPTSRQRYLVEDVPPIHYLSTERDLIVDVQPKPEHGLLLVGGPTYDTSVSPPRSAAGLRSGCAPTGPLRFEDLPGSLAEVRDIAALWSRSKRGPIGDDVVVLSGRAAGKSAVVNAARGRTILHLATHGFFLGECGAAAPGTRSVGGLIQRSRAIPPDTNPLLLSGLAFAGANRPSRQAGQDSGILTAEEVSALHLQGTEWAVLSACDTGVGQTTSGEGVLGLRRAFQVAGVKTVIMSLWSVQDRATRDWMVALYQARLDRLDTAQAVQHASLTQLRDRKAKRLSTHPFYWAAFVAAGDWR
jgi:CHAT domain-containing protein